MTTSFNSPTLALTLSSTLPHLLTHLLAPLPSSSSIRLRPYLSSALTSFYAPHWHTEDPARGSAYRCLIASPARLPRVLRDALEQAKKNGVEIEGIEQKMAGDGWQVWCDPGCVAWREQDDGASWGWNGICERGTYQFFAIRYHVRDC